MNTILVGVDASEHSEDAIAFAARLARASEAEVVVACAYGSGLKQQAQRIAWRMSHRLDGVERDRIRTCAVATSTPDHGLHDLAASEGANIVVVGAAAGLGARLLHDSTFAVAAVPDGYRTRAHQPIRRIGVAYDASPESRAAVVAAIDAVHAFGAELEVITVLTAPILATPTLMGGPGYVNFGTEFGREARDALDTILAELPTDVPAEGTMLDGRPAHQLARRSERLDLLLLGSRGYSRLHALLADGVSARVLRDARCPVIAVPRGAAPMWERARRGSEARRYG